MPRSPRIQFAGANDHIATRGDGRRKLFHDTGHYERSTQGLENEVQRSGGVILADCWHGVSQPSGWVPRRQAAAGTCRWARTKGRVSKSPKTRRSMKPTQFRNLRKVRRSVAPLRVSTFPLCGRVVHRSKLKVNECIRLRASKLPLILTHL